MLVDSRKSTGVVGWGLVGLGRHADQYIAPAFAQAAESRLAAVFSADTVRAEAFAARHGVPRAYSALADMLDDPAISCVYVCSPNHRHYEHVVQAASANRHVLCEKPLATTVMKSRLLVTICAEGEVTLGVGFHLRHNPVHLRVRKLVAEGAVGTPLHLQVNYVHENIGDIPAPSAWRNNPALAGGGSFVGTGVHAADLARYLLDSELTVVSATEVDAGPDEHGPNLAIVTSLRAARGSLVTLVSGRAARPHNGVSVLGTDGFIEATGSIGNIGGGVIAVHSGTHVTQHTSPPSGVYVRQINDFALSIRSGKAPLATGTDGVRAAELSEAVDAALRDARAGAAVRPCEGNT